MTVRDVSRVLSREPQAVAQVQGSGELSCIRGEARFYQTGCGTLVAAEARGLPGGKGCGVIRRNRRACRR